MLNEFTRYWEKPSATDLCVVTAGCEECRPSHFFGPAIRDHYLLHVVCAGRGIFRNQAGNHRITAGSLFLIRPSELTYYQADAMEPWTYYWIGFDGLRARELLSDAGFAKDRPVLQPVAVDRIREIVRSMADDASTPKHFDLGCLGALYLLLHLLSAENASKEEGKLGSREYFREAVRWMEQNYPYRIGIDALSKRIGLDRTALFRAFVRESGMSPQEYLIRFRIGKAGELLRKTTLSVAEIAESVGIPNGSHFSDLFKSRTGLSPRDYRRSSPEMTYNHRMMKQ
jgi:AraC-like DNA-binding protein